MQVRRRVVRRSSWTVRVFIWRIHYGRLTRKFITFDWHALFTLILLFAMSDLMQITDFTPAPALSILMLAVVFMSLWRVGRSLV